MDCYYISILLLCIVYGKNMGIGIFVLWGLKVMMGKNCVDVLICEQFVMLFLKF